MSSNSTIGVGDAEKLVARNYIDCFDQLDVVDRTPQFRCQIEGCEATLSSKSSAIRHLKRFHIEIYESIGQKKNEISKVEESYKWIELRVKVDPQEILRSCVELIAKNAMPLCFVEFPAFRAILKPYKIALASKGIELNITKKNIKEYIATRATEIKQQISARIKNKIISLMIDIASRYNRTILGVNVAHVVDGNVFVHTIGMHVIKCTQTASNIVQIIKGNLNEFGISLHQILGVTTENGKNMLKSVALLDAEYQDTIIENIADATNNDTASDIGDDYEEESIDEDVFDGGYYNVVLEQVCHQFENTLYTDLIHGVHCAAHCLHLVVTKSISSCTATANLTMKCRKLVEKLRTPTFRGMMASAKLKSPMLDCKTRWSSTYLMVFDFLKIQYFILVPYCENFTSNCLFFVTICTATTFIRIARLL